MISHRRTGILAAAALAMALVVAGCKSSTPATTQPATDNGQAATATQPGASPATGASSGAPASAPAAAGPAPVSSAAPAPQAPPPPAAVDLPEGTQLRVRLDEDLGSKISQPGDSFSATVADDVRVDGQVVIAKGARADGTVVDAKPLGKFAGGARLEVRLDRVQSNWGSYAVSTGSIDRVEKGKGKRSAGLIGGGAGLGAIIGGLAGGGKGAAIGALAGGGAGTAGSAFTGNKQIVLPAETLLTFKLEHSVHITMK
ncbi:MAG TPA: hypothetical protein VHD85_13025 [Terracidiphilus sp.]|nr:hypothetical protein [Terracidiphilus sp.]